MTLKYVEGDLFDHIKSGEDIVYIAHVCNDQGKWGAGFVLPLAEKYPVSRQAYIALANRTPIPHEVVYDAIVLEMGRVQVVQVDDGESLPPFADKSGRVRVANMIAQTLGGERPLHYNHLTCCMDFLADHIKRSGGGRIICPMFGSGLAGGNFNFIEELIKDCWIRQGIDVTVCYFTKFLPSNFTPPPTGNFQVTLGASQYVYTVCNRCGVKVSRMSPAHPSQPITVGGERCLQCSGYMIPQDASPDE